MPQPARLSAAKSSPAGSRGRWLAARAFELGVLTAALWLTQPLAALWRLPNGDVDEYYQYALTFWTQRPLLHALPAEYPPLAVLPFSLTLLPPADDYHRTFAFWMAALVVLGYLGFLRFANRRRAIFYVGYLLLAAAATLLSRFDIVPALVALAALWAAERRRFGLAYVLVAAGTLLKLYPIVLLPIVAIEQWRFFTGGSSSARQDAEGEAGLAATAGDGRNGRHPPAAADPREPVPQSASAPNPVSTASTARRPFSLSLPFSRSSVTSVSSLIRSPAYRPTLHGVTLCLALIAAGFAGALALNTQGTLSTFLYAGQRPLQVESTPASLLWLGTLAGIPAFPDYSYVSLNYTGLLDGLLRPLSALALVGGCVLVYWRQARGRLSIGRAVVACLAIVLVTNKIFSPQYLIWLLPVVAYVEGFDPLWVAICFLTWLDFPIIYQQRHPIITVPYNPDFMPEVALRNALLLWAAVRAIIAPERAGGGGVPPQEFVAAGEPSVRSERASESPALSG